MGIRRFLRLRPRTARALEAQMREEIETHIALAVEALVRRGVAPDRAAELARARFGDFDTSLRTLTASARHERPACTGVNGSISSDTTFDTPCVSFAERRGSAQRSY